MSHGGDKAQGRLAIIAGRGLLPRHVAEAARRAGEDPFIVALSDEADGQWAGYEYRSVGIGDFSTLSRLFKEKQIGRVVMSGAVTRRPEWRDIRPTVAILAKLPAALRTLLSGGDDAVLKMVIGLIEGRGLKVVGAHEIAPDLLALTGPIGGQGPKSEDIVDIGKAVEAAQALGRLDIGQGSVAVGGRIVALEGPEGTDKMLDRVLDLRASGRISQRRRGVLVKLCKPQQDIRVDLPAIGLSTVRRAAAAGLAGIALEAGRSLILDREAMIAAADEAGLFVCGLDLRLPKWGL